MKTFLKVVVLLVVSLLALKFIRVLLGVGGLLAGLAFGLIALGVSAIVAVLGFLLALVAALSPLWIPALVIVGALALINRSRRRVGSPASG